MLATAENIDNINIYPNEYKKERKNSVGSECKQSYNDVLLCYSPI